MMCRPTNRQGRLSASRPQHMILGSECFQGDLGAGWKCSVNVALHWNRPVVCRPTNRGTRALISARAKFGVSEGSRLMASRVREGISTLQTRTVPGTDLWCVGLQTEEQGRLSVQGPSLGCQRGPDSGGSRVREGISTLHTETATGTDQWYTGL